MNDAIFFFFFKLSYNYPVVDRVAVFFGDVFPYFVLLFALVFFLIHHEIFSKERPLVAFGQKWKEFALMFFSALFSWVLAILLKYLIQVERPAELFTEIEALFIAGGYSFPSEHAALFFAIARSIQFFHKKAGYLFFFFALIISIARIISGVHSPLDVLGGFILGSLIAFIFHKILKAR